MFTHRSAALSVLLILTSASLCWGQDLSKYRDFQFGTNVESVLKRTGMKRSEVRPVYQRPALIEELEWNHRRSSDSQPMPTSLREIRFTFYNDELFKMVISYDSLQTEGLTTDDVVEAISAEYGKATASDTLVTVSADNSTFQNSERVLALWQDPQYSYSLFRSVYGSSFGLVIASKERGRAALTARDESLRLDLVEAPLKELERQKRADSARAVEQEKARIINKPKFRP